MPNSDLHLKALYSGDCRRRFSIRIRLLSATLSQVERAASTDRNAHGLAQPVPRLPQGGGGDRPLSCAEEESKQNDS